MEILERSSGYWIVDDFGVVDGPFILYSEALENLKDNHFNYCHTIGRFS